jgi:nitrite reductase/ring-hydroxylating ferredoxin subunit
MKHHVASLESLKEKKKMQVTVKYQDILLIYENHHVYAIMDKCPHQGIPLATGMVNGNVIKCKDHGLAISLDSGEVISERQITFLRLDRYSRSVKTYEVSIEEDNVFINL